eukprot:6544_1
MVELTMKQKLEQKFGKPRKVGAVRRQQHKTSRRSVKQDDKRLQSSLRKLNVNTIPAIEEVNLFREDGKIIHFDNPTVQASIAANTYAVSGDSSVKEITDLLPGILSQLGPENLEQLKEIAAEAGFVEPTQEAEDDDDFSDGSIPDLVENANFEDAANGETA